MEIYSISWLKDKLNHDPRIAGYFFKIRKLHHDGNYNLILHNISREILPQQKDGVNTGFFEIKISRGIDGKMVVDYEHIVTLIINRNIERLNDITESVFRHLSERKYKYYLIPELKSLGARYYKLRIQTSKHRWYKPDYITLTIKFDVSKSDDAIDVYVSTDQSIIFTVNDTSNFIHTLKDFIRLYEWIMPK